MLGAHRFRRWNTHTHTPKTHTHTHARAKHTGVGPDPADLLMFVTANLVPRAEARVADTRPRPADPALFARDGCASALLGQVLCAQGPDEACCKQVEVRVGVCGARREEGGGGREGGRGGCVWGVGWVR